MSEIDQYDRSKYTPDMLPRLDERWEARLKDIPNEYWDISLEKLKVIAKIDHECELVRDAMWAEYERAVMGNRKMYMAACYEGICSMSTFYNKIMRDPAKLLYVFTPVVRYEAHLRTMLRTKGSEIIKVILDAPTTKSNGKLDVDIASLQLKTIKQMEDRIKGLPIQRVESHETVVNVNAEMTHEQLISKIKEIEGSLKSIPAESHPVNGGENDSNNESIELGDESCSRDDSGDVCGGVEARDEDNL